MKQKATVVEHDPTAYLFCEVCGGVTHKEKYLAHLEDHLVWAQEDLARVRKVLDCAIEKAKQLER